MERAVEGRNKQIIGFFENQKCGNVGICILMEINLYCQYIDLYTGIIDLYIVGVDISILDKVEKVRKCGKCGKNFVYLDDNIDLCIFCHAKSIGSRIEKKEDSKKIDKEVKELIKEVMED